MPEYKDVLRVEGAEATLLTTTLKNKMIGFGTDGQHRMLRKNAAGDPDYWTADGYNVTYGNITIGEYTYHDGDLTTYLRFTTGKFELVAGGKTYIETGYTGLKLDEQVIVGQYILPYTGGQYNQALGVNVTGAVSWIDVAGTTGMRISDSGALQKIMVNDTGGVLTWGWLLKSKADIYPNGVDYAIEDCQNVIGVNPEGAVSNGDPFWMVTEGNVDVRFFSGMQATAGQLFGMANAFASDNTGIARSTTGRMGAPLGYCLEDSHGPVNIARCHLNAPSNGISGDITLGLSGFSDLTELSVSYHISGNMAVLHLPGFSGTSNAVYIKLTGVPSWLSGESLSYTTVCPVASVWINGGSSTLAGQVFGQFDTLNSTIELIFYDGIDIGWEATGTKGLYYALPLYYFVK